MGALWNFFKSGPNATPLTDEKEIKSKFNLFRWQVFGSITIGYALFYVLRLNFSVIKKPLMSMGILNAQPIRRALAVPQHNQRLNMPPGLDSRATMPKLRPSCNTPVHRAFCDFLEKT